MTSSDIIEEVLIKSHSLGIEAMAKADAYTMAFNEISKL